MKVLANDGISNSGIEALEAALTLNLSNEHCSVLDQASRYADSDTASQ